MYVLLVFLISAGLLSSVSSNDNNIDSSVTIKISKCSEGNYCPNGSYCCSGTTCCPISKYCCARGKKCCTFEKLTMDRTL